MSAAACAVGPASVVELTPAPSRVTVVELDDDEIIHTFLPEWGKEARRRYPSGDLVVAGGHGHYDISGRWMVGGQTVRSAATDLKCENPEARVVLVICNSYGVPLDMPGVSYARARVWTMPDRMLHWRFFNRPRTVGNIFEFEENP